MELSDGVVMRVYQPIGGISLEQAAANVRAIATEHEEPVVLVFCGVPVPVWPDYSTVEIADLWRAVNQVTMGVRG